MTLTAKPTMIRLMLYVNFCIFKIYGGIFY